MPAESVLPAQPAAAEAAPEGPMVQVEGLRKRYGSGGPEAVAGVDFAVRRGEVFGLLGPKGMVRLWRTPPPLQEALA